MGRLIPAQSVAPQMCRQGAGDGSRAKRGPVCSFCVVHPDTELSSTRFGYSDAWVEVETQQGQSQTSVKEAFEFDRVFSHGSSQEKVYQEVAKQAVLDALCHLSSAAFIAVGPSGAGKTFLITGGAKRFADRGLIPRSISTLFDALAARPDGADFSVSVSFYEIYKDSVVDLLTPRGRRIPWPNAASDGEGNGGASSSSAGAECWRSAVPPGLQRCTAETESDAYQLLFQGDSHRHFDMLPRNPETSLGHVFFVVHLTHKPTSREAALAFVDLAAEIGIRSHAAVSISWSLNALRAAVAAMREGRPAPFGASILTRLMRPFLEPGTWNPSRIAFLHPALLSESTLDEQREWLAFAKQIQEAMSLATLAPAGSLEYQPPMTGAALAVVQPDPQAAANEEEVEPFSSLGEALAAAAYLGTSPAHSRLSATPPQTGELPARQQPLQQPRQQQRQDLAVQQTAQQQPPVTLQLKPHQTEREATMEISPNGRSTRKSGCNLPSPKLPDLRAEAVAEVKGSSRSSQVAAGTSLTCSAQSVPSSDAPRVSSGAATDLQLPLRRAGDKADFDKNRQQVTQGAALAPVDQGSRSINSNQPEPEPFGMGSTFDSNAVKAHHTGNISFLPTEKAAPTQLLPSVAPAPLPAACKGGGDVATAAGTTCTPVTLSSAPAGTAPTATTVDGADAAPRAKVPQPVKFSSISAPSGLPSRWQHIGAVPKGDGEGKLSWAGSSVTAVSATSAVAAEANIRSSLPAQKVGDVQPSVAPPPLRLHQGAQLSGCASDQSFFQQPAARGGAVGPLAGGSFIGRRRSPSREPTSPIHVGGSATWSASSIGQTAGSHSPITSGVSAGYSVRIGARTVLSRHGSVEAPPAHEQQQHMNMYAPLIRWAPPPAGLTSGPSSRAHSPTQIARSVSPCGLRGTPQQVVGYGAHGSRTVAPVPQPTSPHHSSGATAESPHHASGSMSPSGMPVGPGCDMQRAAGGWVAAAFATLAPGGSEGPPRAMTPIRSPTAARALTPQRGRGSSPGVPTAGLQWRPPVPHNGGSQVRSCSPAMSTTVQAQGPPRQQQQQHAQRAQSPMPGNSLSPSMGSRAPAAWAAGASVQVAPSSKQPWQAQQPQFVQQRCRASVPQFANALDNGQGGVMPAKFSYV